MAAACVTYVDHMWQDQRNGTARIIRMIAQTAAPEQIMADLVRVIGGDLSSRWVVDVDGLRSVNSEMIATLISLVRQVDAAGGRLVLARVTPTMLSVLTASRLERVLPAHADLTAALDAVTA